MKNKIIIILMCLVILTACGRKGDPEYQANDIGTVTYNF
ncbi:MAG: lipoprotein [Candidatus Pelagibacter sp.]